MVSSDSIETMLRVALTSGDSAVICGRVVAGVGNGRIVWRGVVGVGDANIVMVGMCEGEEEGRSEVEGVGSGAGMLDVILRLLKKKGY